MGRLSGEKQIDRQAKHINSQTHPPLFPPFLSSSNHLSINKNHFLFFFSCLIFLGLSDFTSSEQKAGLYSFKPKLVA